MSKKGCCAILFFVFCSFTILTKVSNFFWKKGRCACLNKKDPIKRAPHWYIFASKSPFVTASFSLLISLICTSWQYRARLKGGSQIMQSANSLRTIKDILKIFGILDTPPPLAHRFAQSALLASSTLSAFGIPPPPPSANSFMYRVFEWNRD